MARGPCFTGARALALRGARASQGPVLHRGLLGENSEAKRQSWCVMTSARECPSRARCVPGRASFVRVGKGVVRVCGVGGGRRRPNIKQTPPGRSDYLPPLHPVANRTSRCFRESGRGSFPAGKQRFVKMVPPPPPPSPREFLTDGHRTISSNQLENQFENHFHSGQLTADHAQPLTAGPR